MPDSRVIKSSLCWLIKVGSTSTSRAAWESVKARKAPMALDRSVAAGMTVTPFDVDAGTARFDLVVFVTHTSDQVTATWNYSTDLLDEARVRGEGRELVELLEVREPPRANRFRDDRRGAIDVAEFDVEVVHRWLHPRSPRSRRAGP